VKVAQLAVESLRELRDREIQRSMREIPTIQKNVARKMKLVLAKYGVELELEM
jgi:hypothetical protein